MTSILEEGMKTRKLFWFSLVTLFALALSACGASSKEPTPTPVDPNQIATNAIATFSMGLTQTAFAQPTATFTPEPTATNTLAPATFSPFGTNTLAVAPTSTCDVLVFVDETVKDGTPMAPGQVFPKMWRIKNGGTCTWTPTYKVVFTGSGNGSNMGGATTPIGKTVKPGESIDITVIFTAPTTPGDYASWWKIQNDSGVWLGGTSFSVAIKVVGATAPTSTPTETPIPTP
jgi:hypothetical protein